MKENTLAEKQPVSKPCPISPKDLLKHWQGHRGLTRRVIGTFPEKELFHFSLGGMRPFADMALEMIDMAAPGIEGILTDEWKAIEELDHQAGAPVPKTKEELLQTWDKVTERIDTQWPEIPESRFQEVALAFGQYRQPVYLTLLYFIGNEIHHRGQAYVYLRALGIEPPPFWDQY